MAYSRESLNEAVSLKLTDLDQATGLHKALFTTTQVAGVVGVAGAVLIAPLALEVGAIVGVAGGIFYGISQLVQSKRVGHFLPVPGVGLSAGQLTYGLGAIAARIMGESEPVAPDEVKLIPSDWLPEKERRINYLLQHCPDIIISAAERAQEGISFAAIVDSAVRASEFAITDAQISNPITSMKLAGEVRKVLTGDTSGIEAQQTKAIAAEYKRAQTALAAGKLSDDEFADIEAQVEAIAPNVLEAASPAIAASATPVDAVPVSNAAHKVPGTNEAGERFDWQLVFGLIKDQNEYPAVVVIGPQGVGKTTLVEYLLSILKYEKIVLDPHYEMGAWPGCRVIGAAMNYAAVGEALANISADVAERYKQRATYKGYKPKPVTLVLEEQTNWAGKVDGAGKFLKESLSDVRKVGYRTISVAHSDTNTARGGAAGTSKMRKQGELKITLLEKGLAEISLKGREVFQLRYPDPTPYTIAMGEPVVADDGSLGIGFVGSNKDPKPFKSGSQGTIDVYSAPAADEPAAPAPTPSQPSQWELCKLHTSTPGLRDLMEWIEGTSKTQFSARDAIANKQLRSKLPDSSTEGVRALLEYLVSNALLVDAGNGDYQLSHAG